MTATQSAPAIRFTTPAPGVVSIAVEHPDGQFAAQTFQVFDAISFDPDTGEVQARMSDAARQLILGRNAGNLSEVLADRLLEQLLAMFADHQDEKL